MSDNKILSISEMQQSFIDATQTDEPVAIETQSGSHVNGDTTKTGTNSPKDYTLEFYLPVVDGKYPQGAELVMGGTAYRQLVKAPQKFISARVARKVRNYASTVAIAFTKFKERGDSELYTVEELLDFYDMFDDDVINAFEKLLSTALGVDENLMEYITDTSLIENCSKLISNNPSFFQED